MSKIKIPVIYANLDNYVNKNYLENYVTKEELTEQLKDFKPSGSGENYIIKDVIVREGKTPISMNTLKENTRYRVIIQCYGTYYIDELVTSSYQNVVNEGSCLSLKTSYIHPMGDEFNVYIYNASGFINFFDTCGYSNVIFISIIELGGDE